MQLASKLNGQMPPEQNEEVEFSSVPVDHIDDVWPVILPMIESGLSHGQGEDTTAEILKESVKSGDMHLWVIHKGYEVLAGVILSVKNQATGVKVFVEMLAGNDMKLWADELQSLLIDFKDLVGANYIEASCRHGLAKFLGDRGWNKKAIIMELR